MFMYASTITQLHKKHHFNNVVDNDARQPLGSTSGVQHVCRIIDLEVVVYRRLVVITFLLILVILDLDRYVRVH